MNKKLQYLFFCLPAASLVKFMVVAPGFPEVVALIAVSALFGFAFWRMDKDQYEEIEAKARKAEERVDALEKQVNYHSTYISSMKLGQGMRK